MDDEQFPEVRRLGRDRHTRRRFLQAASAIGAGILAGCTVTIDDDGIRWGGDDDTNSSGEPGTAGGEEYEDGTGEGAPAQVVMGTRDGIDIIVGPYDQVVDGDELDFSALVNPRIRDLHEQDVRVQDDLDLANAAITTNTMDSTAGSGFGFPAGSSTGDSLGAGRRGSTVQSKDNIVCHTEQKTIEVGSGEALLLNPTQSIFYPGAIIDVRTIPSGEYRLLSAPRAPLMLSADFPSAQIDGSRNRVVENPSLSSVRDAVDDIIDHLNPDAATVADMAYSYERVFDESQTNVLLGAHYDGVTTEVNSSFEYATESTTNEILVKYVQRYFAIDVDLENRAVFADGRTPDPTDALVSRVNYGRVLLFTVRSQADITDLEASVDATFSGVVREGGVDVGAEHESVMEEAEVNVTVIGGAAATGAGAIDGGVDEIGDFITSGASYGPQSPAAPIGYQLTYLSDLSNAGVHLSTDYVRRECEELQTTFRVGDFQLTSNDGDINVYGSIKMRGVYDEDEYINPRGQSNWEVWNRDDDAYLSLDEHVPRNVVGAGSTIEFPTEAVEDYDESEPYIIVRADLWRRRRIRSNQFLGWDSTRVFLDEVGSVAGVNQVEMEFTGEGNDVTLSFTVTPVYD